MFGTGKDYNEINDGVHRNRSNNIVAPCLLSHLSFWHGSTNIEDVKIAVDDFIITLGKSLKQDIGGIIADVNIVPRIIDKSILFSTVVDSNSFATRFTIANAKQKLELHELTLRQYNELTATSRHIALEFEWNELPVSVRCEVHTEYFTITTIIQINHSRVDPNAPHIVGTYGALNDNIEMLRSYFSKFNSLDKDSNRDIGIKLNMYFYKTFWEDYDASVYKYDKVFDSASSSVFGTIFGEFRGVIMSHEATSYNDPDFFREGKPPVWGNKAKEQLLPLVNIPRKIATKQRLYECVINYMLDGNVLYFSSLAPQVPEDRGNIRIPVEFLFYVQHHDPENESRIRVNKWQLGILVQNLLLLGTTRLASLKHLRQLRIAGNELAKIDPVTNGFFSSIKPNSKELLAQLRSIGLSFQTLCDTFSASARAGIMYRIERSRFYINEFTKKMPLLRIARLDGDEPYGTFVERRLGADFDFIDRLGKRYERTLRSISILEQTYLALIITKIQKVADIALLGVLVPYYGVHLVEHFTKETIMPTLTLVIWLPCLCFACYRVQEDTEIANTPQTSVKRALTFVKRTFFTIAPALFIICIVCILYYFDLLRINDEATVERRPSIIQNEQLSVMRNQHASFQSQLDNLLDIMNNNTRDRALNDFATIQWLSEFATLQKEHASFEAQLTQKVVDKKKTPPSRTGGRRNRHLNGAKTKPQK
jgi:uncharacterized membrane protein YqaE (UPF0057 family)